MRSTFNLQKLVRGLTARATGAARKYARAEQSPLVLEARKADDDFAEEILAAMQKVNTVEDAIFLEKSLQRMDLLRAKNEEDRDSITAAQKRYEQFGMTIELARKNPDSYIRLCMANIKNKNASPYHILAENSIAFVNGNTTRLRSRAAFVPDSERGIWDARIALAEKTIELFTELHNSLADGFEEKQGTAAR